MKSRKKCCVLSAREIGGPPLFFSQRNASNFLPEPLGSVGASPANGSRRQGTLPLATKP